MLKELKAILRELLPLTIVGILIYLALVREDENFQNLLMGWLSMRAVINLWRAVSVADDTEAKASLSERLPSISAITVIIWVHLGFFVILCYYGWFFMAVIHFIDLGVCQGLKLVAKKETKDGSSKEK